MINFPCAFLSYCLPPCACGRGTQGNLHSAFPSISLTSTYSVNQPITSPLASPTLTDLQEPCVFGVGNERMEDRLPWARAPWSVGEEVAVWSAITMGSMVAVINMSTYLMGKPFMVKWDWGILGWVKLIQFLYTASWVPRHSCPKEGFGMKHFPPWLPEVSDDGQDKKFLLSQLRAPGRP